jgi:hypothetical protein
MHVHDSPLEPVTGHQQAFDTDSTRASASTITSTARDAVTPNPRPARSCYGPRAVPRRALHILPLTLTAAASTALLASSAAHAQSAPTQPLQGVLWSPPLATDPDAMPRVEGTRLPGQLNWNAGIAVQFLERPYVGRTMSGGTTSLVSHQLWTNYIVQVGLLPSLAVALDVPVLLTQGGDLTPLGQTGPASVGFGDVRMQLRWSTRRQASPSRPGSPANRSADNTFINEGPGLAVALGATAPTGDARGLTGAGAWTLHPTVIGDFRLFGLLAAAQIGYRFRFDEHWPGQGSTCEGTTAMGMPDVSCLSTTPLRDSITYSAGVRIPAGLLKGWFSPFIEYVGQFDARRPGQAGTTPMELGGGLQRTFGEFTATLAAAGGLTDSPGNPRVRVMAVLQWAPRFVDEDNDGLRDNTGEDQCVGLPEDRDGYQDNDGCPEDNDNDEIPDNEDRCPMVDEDVDGFQDDDGCPDPDNDNDGVPDAQDQCPNGAMGSDPDEARPGCPRDDDDRDGIGNAQDQCPNEPAGARPDASRPGCPSADRDHDGVPDANDACPDAPQGDGARADQVGCPDLDHDHDGVLDANDHCEGAAETINGVDDADGCPENPAPRNARVRVRIVGANPQNPGSAELLETIRFVANDAIAPASDAALAQLALAIIATSRNPHRYYMVSVALTPPNVRGAAAIDAARANRRRDAIIAALRAHGVPEWAVRPADPSPAPARPVANDRGFVLLVTDTVPRTSPAASTAPNAPASAAPSSAPAARTPSNAPPSAAPAASAPTRSAAASATPGGSHTAAPSSARPGAPTAPHGVPRPRPSVAPTTH